MRRVSLRLSVLAFVALALVAVGRPGPGAVAQDATPAAAAGQPVVGVWVLDTDTDDPANAPEVVAFTADGVYISADAEGFPSLGVWEPTGERTATLTIVSTGADDAGGFFGTFTVRASVEVDAAGEAFTAEYTGAFVEAGGTGGDEYGPGTATATRLAAEAPGTPVGPLAELFGDDGEGTPEGTPAG